MAPNLFVRARIAPFVFAAALIAGGAGVSGPEVPVQSRGQATGHLAKRISVDLRGQSLRDAIAYIAGVAGLEAEPFWVDVEGRAGLDPEVVVTLRLRNTTIQEAIERILAAIPFEAGDEPTWQLGEGGILEVGPRSRLNSHHRVETYSIADLVRQTPNFTDAPKIDLAAALQANGGGTIFTGDEGGTAPTTPETAETPAERLVRLITTLIEPEQWRENGGSGASIHIFRDSLVVDAPEYIHRQIAGSGR